LILKRRGLDWVLVQFALFGVYLALPWRRAILPWAVPGLVLLAAGGALTLAALRRWGLNLTPLPVPPERHELFTGGAYAIVRHPIYSGLFLSALGWAITSGDELRLVVTAVLAVFFDRKARLEERIMTERFPDYPAYASRVKRLVPWIY
jgi:protein-S-isoprenylcysteine O-methyltransferase Ste14